MSKDIKYLCIGCFSPWKRQRDITFLGKDLYCIGNLEPDGQEDYQAVVNAGATVEVGYFPVSHIRDLYRRAQKVILPAIHGSERTLLEAYSMNIPVEIVHPDINKRLASYEKEFKESGFKTTRDFILKKYSHIKFAEAIMKGISEV